MNMRPLIMARLLLRFVGHCVLSGVSTARVILQRGRSPAGLVRLRFAPMSETGAAVFGAMVTLTPGSSVIDIDMHQREMLLHLLDTSNAEAAVAAIRRDFERDITALFPEVRT
jgi:multisubunit Na+/H+ antiporter MnhE subunit